MAKCKKKKKMAVPESESAVQSLIRQIAEGEITVSAAVHYILENTPLPTPVKSATLDNGSLGHVERARNEMKKWLKSQGVSGRAAGQMANGGAIRSQKDAEQGH